VQQPEDDACPEVLASGLQQVPAVVDLPIVTRKKQKVRNN
jgi:hypothetical protein